MSEKRIYFLRPIGQIGPIKIGCSIDPELRLETYLAWSPIRLELIVACTGGHGEERRIHGMFCDDWMHHEWFSASRRLLDFVQFVQDNGCLPELPTIYRFPAIRKPRKERAPRVISQKTIDFGNLVRESYLGGSDVAELAELHGKSRDAVYLALKAVGVTMRRGRPRKDGPRSVSDTARAQEMADLYGNGKTLMEIGAVYGVTRERVRQILRAFGVESLGWRQRPAVPATEQEKEIAALYLSGSPLRQLRERFGPGVATALKKLGTGAKKMDAFRETIRERDERAVAMYLRGDSVEVIAKAVGFSHGTYVYRSLKRRGVSTNRPVFGCAKQKKENAS